jgi:hypothetical protein
MKLPQQDAAKLNPRVFTGLIYTSFALKAEFELNLVTAVAALVSQTRLELTGLDVPFFCTVHDICIDYCSRQQ